MKKLELEANAEVILGRLRDDPSSLGFYCKSIIVLGFPRCYELSSLALQKEKDGEIRTSPAQYFNGCVMREVNKRGLTWKSKKYAR